MVMHIDHNELYCIKSNIAGYRFRKVKLGRLSGGGLLWAWGVCDPMPKFGASWRRSNGQSGYSKNGKWGQFAPTSENCSARALIHSRATLAFKLKVTASGCNLADSPNAIIASEAALPIQPFPNSKRPYGGHSAKGLPRSWAPRASLSYTARSIGAQGLFKLHCSQHPSGTCSKCNSLEQCGLLLSPFFSVTI